MHLLFREAIAKRMHALSRAPAAAGFGITGLAPADLMSPAMARMFRRAFGWQWITTRPTAADWHRALEKAIKRLSKREIAASVGIGATSAGEYGPDQVATKAYNSSFLLEGRSARSWPRRSSRAHRCRSSRGATTST